MKIPSNIIPSFFNFLHKNWCIFLIMIITSNTSCKKDQKATITIKDQMVDTSFGLAAYNVYCSDTSWNQMLLFGDSLKSLYNPTKVFTIVTFIYPEDAVPSFKKNSYTIHKNNSKNYYIIGKYDYIDSIKGPALERIPESFIKAKSEE